MQPDEVETWKRALLRFRAEKDEYMRHGRDSPFSLPGAPEFKRLEYFDPDPEYRFPISLVRYPSESAIIMTTSRGTRQLFNRVGRFELVLHGQGVLLTAFQSAEREETSLFVPFKDSTSGKETYGAGRYLDMAVQHDDKYLVDFNYAYSPYCAYNDAYVCPIPPRENWLAVAIRAGEKKYHE